MLKQHHNRYYKRLNIKLFEKLKCRNTPIVTIPVPGIKWLWKEAGSPDN